MRNALDAERVARKPRQTQGILVGYSTALDYWRRQEEAPDASAHKRRTDTRKAEGILVAQNAEVMAESEMRRRSHEEDGQRTPFEHFFSAPVPIDLNRPVQALAAPGIRRHSKTFCTHQCSALPDGSMIAMPGFSYVYLATPEYCFLQMAQKLDLVSLIMLGYELCGFYSMKVAPPHAPDAYRDIVPVEACFEIVTLPGVPELPEEFGEAIFEEDIEIAEVIPADSSLAAPERRHAASRTSRREELQAASGNIGKEEPPMAPGFMSREEPLTNVARLRTFLESAVGQRGRKEALMAIKYILDRSRSPMETAAAMMLTLPYHLGGYKLSGMLLNQEVSVPILRGGITGRARLESDMIWPDKGVCVEYDSDAHHTGSERLAHDAQRRNALGDADMKVFTITRAQCLDPTAFHDVAMQISRAIGKRIRTPQQRGKNPGDKFRTKRRELRNILFADFHNPRKTS